MLKNHKGTLIITSAVLLLPILVGLLLWNKMPESIPIHWNAAGEADGWGSRAMAVFLLPLFLLAMHWICILASCADPKNKHASGKLISLVLWICPFLSLLVSTLVYTAALGCNLSVEIIMPMAMGLLFLIIGNYLPKCKQNYTIGIKVPWALNDEENWNHTHRFAGKVSVIGGAVIMATAIWGNFILFLSITLIMALTPIFYSYLYYRRHGEEKEKDV